MASKSELIKQYQQKYQITEAEAKQLIADDEAVDKMKDSEVNNDLTAEQKKNAKAMRSTTSETKKERPKREKKVNTEKQTLLNLLIAGLGETASDVTITNDEREFTFKSGDTTYKVVMSVPRT